MTNSTTIPSPVAIIDIGSNSVRLVIYRAIHGVYHPILNEKATCGLGKGLRTSGRLNPEGAALAHTTLQRFHWLIEAWHVKTIHAFATAAVREAEDGDAFLQAIYQEFGLTVRLLSGEEEGRYAGYGVLYSFRDANGLIGDLGGSSLELALVAEDHVTKAISLNSGVLSLSEPGSPPLAPSIIQATTEFPTAIETFYAVGGSWRAIAKHAIKALDYPLAQPHGYTLTASTLRPLLEQLRDEPARKRPGLPKTRIPYIPAAAGALLAIIDHFSIQHIVFSGCGVREGYLAFEAAEGLRLRIQDETTALSALHPTRPYDPEAVFTWLKPLLDGPLSNYHSFAHSVCILGNLLYFGAKEHRADLAWQTLIHAPLDSICHAHRVFLGSALYARYSGTLPEDDKLLKILSDQEQTASLVLGLALRLGFDISGQRDDFLCDMPLHYEAETTTCSLAPNAAYPNGLAEKRLKALNKALSSITL